MMNQQTATVSGRQCGACTICCRLLPISTERFSKTTNELCKHCDEGRGCRIYQSRPGFCQDFYCEWRLSPNVPATWRPDRSGIFIQRIAREHIEEFPDAFDSSYAVLFLLLRPDAVDRPALIETIADYVIQRVPAFLAIPGPVGYLPAQIFLNEAMESAATKRDLNTMMMMIRQAFEALNRQQFEPVPGLG